MAFDADSTTVGMNSLEDEPKRFQRFKIMVFNTIEQITSGVSEEEYIQLFGKLRALSKSKTAPIRMLTKIKKLVTDNLADEINIVIEEESIRDSFIKLDQIIDECEPHEGETAWRPNGNVSDHMRSHIMEVKLKHISALQEEVRRREQATERLCREVSCLRKNVTTLSSKLQSIRKHNMEYQLLERIDAKGLDLC